ncbi:MAG TPA: alpha-glucuronidase family glycosyl hydrolase [Candidatus Sulfotelmatobacter sp.]|nr:alpha-glucuronidase family glycosyl hydrolase [Candidatus Sulfotelmatobacter sp.]
MRHIFLAAFISVLFARPSCVQAGEPLDTEAWLRYGRLDAPTTKKYEQLPSASVLLRRSLVLENAQRELAGGVEKMLGRRLDSNDSINGPTIVLGTLSDLRSSAPSLRPPVALEGDGFWITSARIHNSQCLFIVGASDRGVLYGVFALLSKIARGESVDGIDEAQNPYAPIRWVNQWDNLDGRIERGYGGPSIFFSDGKVRSDLTRAGEYARLLASIGINGCTINNVNAAPGALEDSFIAQVKRIADVFRPWGVQLSMSVDLSSPKVIGGLDTFDPLDPRVAEWWRKKADEIYQQMPDFGGVVVKADSEGRSGPSAYGRTHAHAANVIARALKPHGGVVFYRAFVYNHHLDWRDLKNDRAKAAYENFHPLDGKFDDNTIVQIKNGPIDFQVREPVSPLFAGLRRTNEAIELQITQEYTGQQKHLCFLVPMWKEVLDFDMRVEGEPSRVKDLVSGRFFHRLIGGFAGVANVGLDANWLGSPLAMANLYGFGRLAWNPDLSSETVIDEWTGLTFGSDPLVVKTIAGLQLRSWHVYENYTGPLGAGTLTDITGNHYDPGPESSEENGWGQWHRADHQGIGMDRTVATGTGYIGQYPPEVQKLYEALAACPDELLLFFHHVPYTYVLHSGKTVIQHVYDSHREGAEQAQVFIGEWKSLEGHIDSARYRDILARFEFQAGEAVKWRDTICSWIYRLSGIPDQKGKARPQ